ncbi:MAG: ribosome assembly RNA-binding protein YhbY [Polyangiaceae bacterium]
MATPQTLTGKQKRHLRALGHGLDALVQLGKNGLTDSAITAAREAIDRHELIKIRLLTECPEDRDDVAERLGFALGAVVAQTLGRTFLLYRRHPKKPVIELPKAAPGGAKSSG